MEQTCEDSISARIIDCDVLNLSCTEYVTVLAIDRDCPSNWYGRISIGGEDFEADVELPGPMDYDRLRHLYVNGEHDFNGRLVVFHLGKPVE